MADEALDHRDEIRDVRRLVADAVRQDDLVLGIDDELRVVRLHERAVLDHDAAVGIGEVPLRCALGLAVRGYRHAMAGHVGRRTRGRLVVVVTRIQGAGLLA